MGFNKTPEGEKLIYGKQPNSSSVSGGMDYTKNTLIAVEQNIIGRNIVR